MSARNAIDGARELSQVQYEYAILLATAAYKFNLAACRLARTMEQVESDEVGHYAAKFLPIDQERSDEARHAFVRLRGLRLVPS